MDIWCHPRLRSLHHIPVSLSTSFSSWETAGGGGGLNTQSVLSSARVTHVTGRHTHTALPLALPRATPVTCPLTLTL